MSSEEATTKPCQQPTNEEKGSTDPSSSTMFRCTTIAGDTVELTTCDVASKFGFIPGCVVHFTKSRLNGQSARVCGMCSNGMLWFAMLPDSNTTAAPPSIPLQNVEQLIVQTTSCRGKEELIRQYGWIVDPGR